MFDYPGGVLSQRHLLRGKREDFSIVRAAPEILPVLFPGTVKLRSFQMPMAGPGFVPGRGVPRLLI